MSASIVRIPHLLSDEDLDALRSLLADAPFVDGRLSAGESARLNKHNMEADLPDDKRRQADNILLGRLTTHPDYLSAAIPARLARPLYAKYETGMAYGHHVDDPVMGTMSSRYRADIAITIFLNAPSEYDGGELIINSGSEAEVAIKYTAGDAVLYSASTIHRVAKVTRGERLVALTWAQSMITDSAKRELLYQLRRTRDSIKNNETNASELRQLEWIYARLIRMWARP